MVLLQVAAWLFCHGNVMEMQLLELVTRDSQGPGETSDRVLVLVLLDVPAT